MGLHGQTALRLFPEASLGDGMAGRQRKGWRQAAPKRVSTWPEGACQSELVMAANLKRGITRRDLLAAIPASLFIEPALAANQTIGSAEDVRGFVTAQQTADVRSLSNGAALLLKDLVETGEQSFARLELSGATTVRLGSKAKLLIDRFVAEAGGVLRLGDGALLLDRADELPKIDVSIRTRFGLIAVRGTKFFAGPSKGVFGVFVERGSVVVSAAGVRRRLRAGQGVDIAAPGRPPSRAAAWKPPRIAAAYASVGL